MPNCELSVPHSQKSSENIKQFQQKRTWSIAETVSIHNLGRNQMDITEDDLANENNKLSPWKRKKCTSELSMILGVI